MANERDQMLALAGVMQAAQQVNRIARTGEWDDAVLNTAILSLFETEPRTVEDVFGGRSGISPGLRFLQQFFRRQIAPEDAPMSDYVVVILALAKQVLKRDDLFTTIANRIGRLKPRYPEPKFDDDELINDLATLYVDTLGSLPIRAHIKGHQLYLTQDRLVKRIRTLLFAGIRSAILWRQVGGSQFKLVLTNRRRMARLIDKILGEPGPASV